MLFLLPSTRTKTPTSTEEKRDLKTLRLLLWITLERKTFEKDEHKVKSVWGFYNQFFYSFWVFFVDRWKRYENSDVEEYRFPLIGRRILSRICVGGAKTCFISHARMKRSKSRAGHFFFFKTRSRFEVFSFAQINLFFAEEICMSLLPRAWRVFHSMSLLTFVTYEPCTLRVKELSLFFHSL